MQQHNTRGQPRVHGARSTPNIRPGTPNRGRRSAAAPCKTQTAASRTPACCHRQIAITWRPFANTAKGFGLFKHLSALIPSR